MAAPEVEAKANGFAQHAVVYMRNPKDQAHVHSTCPCATSKLVHTATVYVHVHVLVSMTSKHEYTVESEEKSDAQSLISSAHVMMYFT